MLQRLAEGRSVFVALSRYACLLICILRPSPALAIHIFVALCIGMLGFVESAHSYPIVRKYQYSDALYPTHQAAANAFFAASKFPECSSNLRLTGDGISSAAAEYDYRYACNPSNPLLADLP